MLILLAASKNNLAADTLLLKDAISKGLENNFSIKISRSAQQVSHLNNTLGNAGFLPDINLNANTRSSSNNTKQEFYSGELREKTGASTNSADASVQLNWTVFDGMAMFVKKHQLEEFEKIGELETRKNIEKLVAEINSAYFLIYYLQARIKVLDSVLNYSRLRKYIAEEKFKIGSGSGLELLKSEVDLSSDSSAYIREVYNLAGSKSKFNLLMGDSPGTDFQVSENIEFRSDLKYDELLSSAKDQNSALMIARKKMYISELEVKEVFAGFLPRVSLNSGYSLSSSQSEVGLLRSNRNNGIYYGFGATWSIFNGFNGLREESIAKIQNKIASENYLNSELETENDLFNNFIGYSAALSILKFEKSKVRIAKESAEISLQKLRLGNISSIEFRESVVNYAEAELRLINALYELKNAETRLLHISGKLQP